MAHSKSEIKKAKNLLNKFAPKGEQLAYINSKEATLLKRMGGAGKDINGTGIKSYFDPGSGRGSVSESLSESAGLGSSSSNNNNSSNGNDNSPQRQLSSYRSQAPKTAAPRSMLSRIGSGIVTALATIATGGIFGVGKIAATGIVQGAKFASRKGFTNKGGTLVSNARLNDPKGLYAEGLTTGKRNNINMGGGDGGNNNLSASNVGGRIIKLSPTTAEVSQSSATDVTYDSRKTKARGRSMTIRTNSRGVGNNMASVLGTKSLLGAA